MTFRPAPKPIRKKKIPNPVKKGIPKEAVPLEETEQITLASWLDWNGILYCHVPNGGYRHPVTAMRFKALGVKRGCPDILIFTRPVMVENGLVYVGTAIELKRKGNKTTEDQEEWLKSLAELGWKVSVQYSADSAIEWLKSLGYGVR